MQVPMGGPGEFVVVATPIGNLEDLSPRARAVLASADVVYCEDTRRTRVLFSAFGLTPRGRLRSLREHNEMTESVEVVERVASGAVVALVSDAGTPGISDPGRRVVAAVAEAGLRVTTTPGPSAVVAALSVSGLDTERFVMEGFVPRRSGDRRTRFAQWATEARTIVFYESPQRLVATLGELAELFGDRRVVVARELTKLHEELVRGPLREVAGRWAEGEVRGEVVVVLEGAAPAAIPETAVREALERRLGAGETVRDAVSAVADELRVAHRIAYDVALRIRSERGS